MRICEPIESIESMEAVQDSLPAASVVGESAAMRELLQTVARVGPKDITVLIRGETGTGKELIASLVHAESNRASAPLVRFNCAAIPAELAEAELFGHARGAFTGANSARPGFFSVASGGTLVLDEVGELPPSIQAKLLRVLQEGEIQQVGTSRIERVDVRVIACTNRDLAAEVHRGRFRMDLVCGSGEIDLELLKRTRLGSVNTSPDKPASRIAPSLRDQLAALERRIIARTLAAAAGNRSRAAKLLGLSRTALFDRLKKYELATGLDDAAA